MSEELVFPQDSRGFHFTGLTKRELFAAMAMQGLLAWSCPNKGGSYHPDTAAEFAVKSADALIQQLTQPSKESEDDK